MTAHRQRVAAAVAALALLGGGLAACADDSGTQAPSEPMCLAPSETGGGGAPTTTECRDSESVPSDY